MRTTGLQMQNTNQALSVTPKIEPLYITKEHYQVSSEITNQAEQKTTLINLNCRFEKLKKSIFI
jgi:hypothetical protein